MKVIFKHTTSENFKELEDIEGTLFIGLSLFFKFEPTEKNSFEFRHGEFRSSRIKSSEYIERSQGCYDLVFKTNHTTYTFTYGKYDETKPSLTQEEKDFIMLNTMI